MIDKNKVTTEDMMESTYMFFNSYRQKYGEQAATALITSFLKDVEILDTNEIKLSRGFGKGLGIELAYE